MELSFAAREAMAPAANDARSMAVVGAPPSGTTTKGSISLIGMVVLHVLELGSVSSGHGTSSFL